MHYLLKCIRDGEASLNGKEKEVIILVHILFPGFNYDFLRHIRLLLKN